jgi:long-chain acyl-CoA synthetase
MSTVSVPARPSAADPSAGERSLPALLLARADARPDAVALRRHERGRWREVTWSAYAERAASAGLSLLELGVGHGDVVAIHSDNRPEWLFVDLGAQGIGAVSVGIYPTSPPSEVEYLLGHSEASVLVVEDEEQLDKALQVRERLEHLRHIVVLDADSAWRHLDDPQVMTYEAFEALGGQRSGDEYGRLVSALDPSDTATIVYTSGTTGPPKGAMLSHANLVSAASALSALGEVTSRDEVLSYLPLCHIAERMNSEVDALFFGVVVNFGEGAASFGQDLRDVQPTAFLGVPRVWEKMLATVEIHMADASWSKRQVYAFWIRQGRRIGRRRMRDAMRPFDWVVYFFGWLMLYRSLRDKVGLRRIRIAISGAAPIAPEVLEFFWSIGVPVREGYGQTENSSIATFTPQELTKIGKVGKALPGVELRIADDGEILTRSSANFLGYLKNPTATAETLDAEGWLHTGDVGWLDDDGYLTITDRKKDILITAGGKNISPSEIENMLKVSPFVREAVVIGDRRKYLTALIGIELDTVADWASRHRLPYTTYADLSRKPEVHALVGEWVDHVNADLSQVEQIKHFRLLPKELGHEDGQLTATQKVKRKAVIEEFADLIEEMYR